MSEGPAMMAHGYCYLWSPGLVSIHVGSDAVIGIAYLVISSSLGYLVYKARAEIPFGWIVAAFGAFIVACGVTHLLGVWTVWTPAYWISGYAKLVTAAVSVVTAIALPPLIPRALHLLQADRVREEVLAREEAAVRLALYGHQLGWDAPKTDEDRRWTEGLTRLLSCSEADLDRSLEDLLERVHDADVEKVRGAIATARDACGIYDVEFGVDAPDGTAQWLEARGRFWRPRPDGPLRHSGFFWDVTRRRHDEEQLRIAERALQATANGILVCDARQPDIPVIVANESFTEISGFSEAEALGRNCRFMNEGAHDQPALDEVRSAIREKRDGRATLLNRRRNGEWFWNDLTISPVFDESESEVTHFVGVMRDVSAQMALAADRERLLLQTIEGKAEAEQANRAKDEFLALLSHELRTPLQAQTTWLQLAEKEVDIPPQLTRVLTALRRSAGMLSRLVEDLLDSSRLVAQRFSVDRRPLDVSELVDSTINALEALAAERGTLLRIGDRASGAVVNGDQQRLSQVLRALVDNAIKFSSEGGEIVIESRIEGARVAVVVTDQGEGIDPADIPHLFERFAQADTSRSRPHGGLGLGLFLVRSIVQLHGGEVRAESAGRGRGARMTFWLPLAEDAEVVPVEPSGPRVRRSLNGLRMLLVEDDELAAEALAELLGDLGAEVVLAGTARKARAALEEEDPFDLLLSDIGLPDEDGVALLVSIREAESRAGADPLPAVAMSGFTGSGEVAEMMAAGFDAHVSKPIEDFGALQDLLLSLLPDDEDQEVGE